ncbi:MAG TPA: hypothetical protein PLI09_10120 [Candidatus Hydrogenedentes bacterium]|nr:hypothetical protein [Candidatus Hydrogenedentota bacterium]
MFEKLKKAMRSGIIAGFMAFLALGLGIFLAGLVVIGVECYFRHQVVQRQEKQQSGDSWNPNPFFRVPEYGYVFRPDFISKNMKSIAGETVFKVISLTDDCGRRITPVENRLFRTKFLAFFGGSFTYGHGVSDNETLAAQVAKWAPAYMPYNYGLPGYGPSQMLLQLLRHDLRDEIQEQEGIAIYTFIDEHVKRVIGTMLTVTNWAKGFPCFEERDGTLTYLGSFEQAHPYRSLFYRLASHEYILRNYNIDIPFHLERHDIDLTAAIIEESAKRFAEIYPKSRFYVLLYPRMSHMFGTQIMGRLQAHHIPCLDYRQLFENIPPEEVQFPDFHPTPESYARVARILVSDLNLGAQCPGY